MSIQKIKDQEYARTALSENLNYITHEYDVLGEDQRGWIYGPPEDASEEAMWSSFDSTNPRHMAAYEKTKETRRIAFLEST